MPARSLRSGTGTRSTPVPLKMNANSWPAFHLRALRTALGIEIWNFAESVAVSGMVVPLFDRSGIRKKSKINQRSGRSPLWNPESEFGGTNPTRRGGGIEGDLGTAISRERAPGRARSG